MRKRKENLAQLLWDSHGTIFLLLKEIMSIYSFLSPPDILTEESANRVCNALSLIQSTAAHPSTRKEFMKANIQEYLYPFIDTISQEKPFEFLRLTSLSVIGALLKENKEEIAVILVKGDIIPKLIKCLDLGTLISKTMTALILEKLLNIGEDGLNYCCASAERFYAVSRALGRVIEGLSVEPSLRLLKHVISCYLKLSQNHRACDCLRLCLPLKFRDATFHGMLRDDPETMLSLRTLFATVGIEHRGNRALSLGPPFRRSNHRNSRIRPRFNY